MKWQPSVKLKERFCKDNNLSIKVFEEPYFTERLMLYEDMFEAHTKWENFLVEIMEHFNYEEQYFEYYNKVKDEIINFIKDKKEYEIFNSFDMAKLPYPNVNITKKDIFKAINDGKSFVSIDLKKGNFTALRFFNKELVDNKDTYEDFIAKFTSLNHITSSKYIRQVVFGNLNPKRQTHIERYIMGKILMDCIIPFIPFDCIVSYCDDELVLLDDGSFDVEELRERVVNYTSNLTMNVDGINTNSGVGVNVHFEKFLLSKFNSVDVYIKTFDDGTKEIKCANHINMPFVLRYLLGETPNENDSVFKYEQFLVKLLEPIKVD